MKRDRSARAANAAPLGFVFFVAYIGAVVYFVHQSSGFWGFIGAFFKAIAWPGILVYQALMNLGV